MPYKSFTDSSPETIKVWTSMVDQRFRHGTSFKDGRDTSTTPGNAPICQKSELAKESDRGDRIRIIGVDELDGEGTVGDEIIVGKGEAMRTSFVDVTLDQIRHEMESDGNMSQKKTVIDFRKAARDRLARWNRRKVDMLRLIAMSGELGVGSFKRMRWTQAQLNKFVGLAGGLVAPDADHRLYAGDATSVATLDSADLPTYALFAKIKRHIADLDEPPLALDVDGMEHYRVYLDEAILQQLKKDSQFRDVFLHASPRSADNPLLKGVFAQADGFLLQMVPQLVKPAGASTAGAVRRMLVCGADHLYEGWGRGPNSLPGGRFGWREEEGDRGNRSSITTGTQYGCKVNTWTTDDGTTRVWRNGLTVDAWVGTAA